MKKSLRILCLTLSLGLTSMVFAQTPTDSIVGKWQAISKSGGMTGNTQQLDPEMIIEFTSDSFYRRYQGDSLIQQNTYRFVKSKSIYHSRDSILLLRIGNFFALRSFQVYDQKLVLKDECYDCYSRIYRRVSSDKSKENN